MKILSVDDSRTMRNIIHNTVAMLGYGFLEAENGCAALQVLASQAKQVGLILLDWNMPMMDGMSLLKMLKADERYRDIPVIMVTTEAEKSRIIDAVRAGAKHYLTKPFTQEDLVEKIGECLDMEL